MGTRMNQLSILRHRLAAVEGLWVHVAAEAGVSYRTVLRCASPDTERVRGNTIRVITEALDALTVSRTKRQRARAKITNRPGARRARGS